MSKKKLDQALGAPDQLKALMEEGLSLPRLDFLYDQLRLVGAVMALRTLLDVVTFGEHEPSRVAAAKMLMDLKEDPAALAERLKSAPFADLTVAQLEHVVDRLGGGETDLQKLIEEAKKVVPPLEAEDAAG